MKGNLIWSLVAGLATLIFGYGLFVMPVSGQISSSKTSLEKTQVQLATDQRTLTVNTSNNSVRRRNASVLNLRNSTVSPALLESGFLSELQSLEPRVRVTSLKFTAPNYAAVPPAVLPTPSSTPGSDATPLPQRAAPALFVRTGSLEMVGHYRDLLQALAALSTGPLLVQVTGTPSLVPLNTRDPSSDPILKLTVQVGLLRIVPPYQPTQEPSPSPSPATTSKAPTSPRRSP
jgi:hypothetical protein